MDAKQLIEGANLNNTLSGQIEWDDGLIISQGLIFNDLKQSISFYFSRFKMNFINSLVLPPPGKC